MLFKWIFYLSETFLGDFNDNDKSAKADISVAISQDTNINENAEESSNTFTGVSGQVLNRSKLISAQRGDPSLLAHDVPMAGHLGVRKTYFKVLSHLFC